MKYITSSLTALFATRQYQMCGLYNFSLVGALSSLNYASGDVDIYLQSSLSGGDTRWTNQTFVHNQAYFDRKDNRAKLSSAIGTQVSTLLFDVIPAGATIEGQPFLSFVRGGGFDGAVLTYYGAYWPKISSGYTNPLVPTGIINKFVGRVAEVDVGRNLATFSVNCHLELLNIQMPRNLYQAGCSNTLYDAGCTLSQAAFTVSSAVLVNSTSSTIYVSSLGAVSSYALGQITFTSGVLNGVSRTAQSYTFSSASSLAYLTIVPPFPSSPSSGDTFTISQGCDKTFSSCISVFNNLLHYRGFDFIPSPDTSV
jgi:uncharacterized phage protein (TIGR02218 family)